MRRALIGLAALAGVAFILVGWPWLLLTAATGPLVDYLPDLSNPLFAATHPDAAGLLLGVVLVAGLGSWLVTAGALVAELCAQAMGRQAPRLGGANPGLTLLIPQVPMSRLAAAVLFILPMGGQLAGAPVHAAPTAAGPVPPVTASGAVTAGPTAGPTTGTDCQPARYTVERGDTLWGVAEAELGDGQRYPEVFRASRDIRQPGGQHLRDPDVIQPGWQLHIPADADAADCADGSVPPDPSKAGSARPTPPAVRATPPPATPAPTQSQSPAATAVPDRIERGAALPSPAGLRVAKTGPDTATVTWQAVPGATGYLVTVGERSLQTPGSAVSLRGLTSGQDYMVEVRAVFADAGWSSAAVVQLELPPTETSTAGQAGRPGATADPARLRALRHPAARSTPLEHSVSQLPSPPGDAATRCLARMRAASGIHCEDRAVATAARLVALRPATQGSRELVAQAAQLATTWQRGTAAQYMIDSGVSDVRA